MRHGETDWNLNRRTQGSMDIPLNDTGRDQAREAAKVLAEEQWDLMYTSPLQRAAETGQIIAAAVGITSIHRRKELQERHFGVAEGMATDLRREQYGDSGVIPGAETWDDVLQRSVPVIQEILHRYPGNRVLVVSHGGTIMTLLHHLTNGAVIPGQVFLKNGAASLVSWDGNAWHLRWFNR